MSKSAELARVLEQHFGDRIQKCSVAHNEVTLEVAADALTALCIELRDDDAFRFEQLMDVCGVDYSTYGAESPSESARQVREGPRFAVVYHLLSVVHNRRVRLRVLLDGDPPVVDSMVAVWSSANWFEREAFDLFGIVFEGHPDLRRILTDYGFIGHPFRKDFPISGYVEMRYDPEQARVIYEPVSIEPRVGTTRVIREDSRFVGIGVGSGADVASSDSEADHA